MLICVRVRVRVRVCVSAEAREALASAQAALQNRQRRYSGYSLYWYKSTNTDAAAQHARVRRGGENTEDVEEKRAGAREFVGRRCAAGTTEKKS